MGEAKISGSQAVTMGAAKTSDPNSTGRRGQEVGVVCFQENKGLCSILAGSGSNFTLLPLSGDTPHNHASMDGLVAPLEDHSRGSPVLLAVNRKAETANEVSTSQSIVNTRFMDVMKLD